MKALVFSLLVLLLPLSVNAQQKVEIPVVCFPSFEVINKNNDHTLKIIEVNRQGNSLVRIEGPNRLGYGVEFPNNAICIFWGDDLVRA